MTISSDRGMAFEQPVVPARGLAQSAECVDVFGRFARGLMTDPTAFPLFLLGLALRQIVWLCALPFNGQRTNARHAHTLLPRDLERSLRNLTRSADCMPRTHVYSVCYQRVTRAAQRAAV